MRRSYALFERFGVELEYMIVDARSLNVRPEADRLILEIAGSLDEDVSRGPLDWSNELALHLIEFKTGKPVPRLAGLSGRFQEEVRFVNRHLENSRARLLPTAMHPWMNPARESRLWPHGCGEIYAAFDRIFDCSGHGWTNLQSTHLNLSFRTASEFRRLHTAIRLILPLLPALAASSPFQEGRPAPMLDMRLEVYRRNCRRIPSVTGQVIPEPVRSPSEYQRKILQPIYRDLAPFDPEEILREEWANARGAIARFERNTIEIRVLDIQECPAADLALLQFIIRVLRALVDQRWMSTEEQLALSTAPLHRLLRRTIKSGRRARVTEHALGRALGWSSSRSPEAGELWAHLWQAVRSPRRDWAPPVELILNRGSLSERIRQAAGPDPGRARLRKVYGALADCLHQGAMFEP